MTDDNNIVKFKLIKPENDAPTNDMVKFIDEAVEFLSDDKDKMNYFIVVKSTRTEDGNSYFAMHSSPIAIGTLAVAIELMKDSMRRRLLGSQS